MKSKLFFALICFLFSGILPAQNPLAIPDTVTGISINLTLKDSTKQFYTGFNTATFAYNGRFLGPTVILSKGQNVTMNVNNQLTDTTTTHWHGLHVSPKNDGSPHNLILSGATWSPSFTVMDKAATYWYHPHLHLKTELHVTKGASGLIIVRDSAEAALVLPRRYGVDDFPLIIQTKHFDASKQIVTGTPYDSTVLVNGTRSPYLAVPPQIVRLRILNASVERTHYYGLTANKTFSLIAGDGGLLPSPVSLTRLMLSPGERAEILIDFSTSAGQNINLLSYASELPNGIYGAGNPSAMMGSIAGYSGNPLNGNNYNIIQFQVGLSQTANPVTVVPSTLVPATPLTPSLSVQSRTLTITPVVMGPNQSVNGPFQFNGSPFNMAITNYTVPINNIETWNITNNTSIAHPFHIHDVQFYILEINGSTPPLHMQGRKDVVLVPAQQTVRFIAKFDHFCDTIPYMYHCHMLPHEDDGLMGQFKVQCSIAGIKDLSEAEQTMLIFPNPAADRLEFNADGLFSDSKIELSIYDSFGRIIYKAQAQPKTIIEVSGWKSGLYTAQISNGKKTVNKKFVIR